MADILLIDIGASPNDGLGDPLREAFNKTNINFTTLNNAIGNVSVDIVGFTNVGTSGVGVVSSGPDFETNTVLYGEFACSAFITSQDPFCVVGPVKKVSLMVAAPGGYARTEESLKSETIIGKSLSNFDSETGVVGRF